MSSMKGGFTTLNRWFGKKQKDKNGSVAGGSMANGKLSKSTTHLHHMSTDSCMHINEASQLDYNRITPLPAATSNAPFEQTFRITVLLPKDQLYVTRLGARVPLSKLLSLVCDNKQLDPDKYEFRNKADASQVYSCESTIGAVGLSEIRLCHKSESYDTFNADAMVKFQRTGAVRDSLSSSSDFSSSRHSKLTAKTPSPYSSSNSLNSMDSTGMNYTRTPVVPPKALAVAPPPRKKRTAPRPPSQLVIPEMSVAPEMRTQPSVGEPAYAVIVKRPQLCVSTPNLPMSLNDVDCNGNSAKSSEVNGDSHYATLEESTAVVANGNVNGNAALPEPTPRKRLIQLKKKAAPAPPPEGASASGADSISLCSTTASIAAEPPQPAPRITTPTPIATLANTQTETTREMKTEAEREAVMDSPAATTPPPLPASAAPQMLNSNNSNNNNSNIGTSNVSKVLLNRTPTPEPRSLSSAAVDDDDNDAASKKADSGIGEPVPSPSPLPPDSLPSETELKSTCEYSSDDDEAIKVYNFKLGQTSSLKSPPAQFTQTAKAEASKLETKTLQELVVLAAQAEDSSTPASGASTPALPANGVATPSEQIAVTSWNYAAAPISPPPDFSDRQKMQTQSLQSPKSQQPSSPLDECVDELAAIIQEQRLDTLIRKQTTTCVEIESAKPNKLSNFTIGSSLERTTTTSTTTSTTLQKRIARADSFQTSSNNGSLNTYANSNGIGSGQGNGAAAGLSLRSSSHLSLNKLEQNGLALHQRRSSSELSIGESPSLQSLEVIKNILSNSRKNSLVDSNAAAKSAVASTRESQEQQQQQQKQQQLETKRESEKCVKPKNELPYNGTAKCVETQTQTELFSSPAKSLSPTPTPTRTITTTPNSTPTPTPTPITTPLCSPTPSATPAAGGNSAKPLSLPAKPAEPLPSTYRYSGPPSINFATWSERPKSQVAIKNEGDYIFGGKQAPTKQRQSVQSELAQQPAAKSETGSASPKLTIEAAAPILRMGIPRKEYKVPITVKPLRDVSVESSDPPVQSTTLPRPAKSNRYTLPASAHSSISASNSLPRSPIAQLKETKQASEPKAEVSDVPAAPFGQNTLRRTGFKERMLAKEQQEKEQALRIKSFPAPGATTAPTPAGVATLPPKPLVSNKNVIRSSKLELKLPKSPEPTPPAQPALMQVKLRPTSLYNTATATVTVTAQAPPPPAPPTPPTPLLSMVANKSATRAAITPTTPDPRSQLLEAIRNFKREELNRS